MITFNTYKISQTPKVAFGNETPKGAQINRLPVEMPSKAPRVNNLAKSLRTFMMGTAATVATMFGAGCSDELPFEGSINPGIDDGIPPKSMPVVWRDSLVVGNVGVDGISLSELEKQRAESQPSKALYNILDKMNVRTLDTSIQTGKVAANSTPYALDSLAYRVLEDNKLVQIKMDYKGSSSESARMLISVDDIVKNENSVTKKYIAMANSNGEELGLKLYNVSKDFVIGKMAKETSLSVVDGNLNVGKSSVIKSSEEAGKYLMKMLDNAATKAVKVDWVNFLYKSPMVLK